MFLSARESVRFLMLTCTVQLRSTEGYVCNSSLSSSVRVMMDDYKMDRVNVGKSQ